MAIDTASTTRITPLPDGDYEARRGPLAARAPTVAEAEAALAKLLEARWEDLHVKEKPPVPDEDHEDEATSEDS
ncbi:MAG TPA: hypothetical protein VMI31_10825 [Fimbriimonadaceae bacterium]|nr:hypothetical protein [Fimbriimonadaceae bacterium]